MTPGLAMDTSSFETDLDGWTAGTSSPTGTAGWTQGTGGTPSAGTGPSGAAVGAGYSFVEVSWGAAAHLNTLERTFPAGQELYGITFQYHMYSSPGFGNVAGFGGFGDATLESSADGVTWQKLWTKRGNLGNQWYNATAFVPGGGHTKLRYTYVFNCC